MHGVPGTIFWPSTAWLALSQCNFVLHSMQAALDCLDKRRTVLLACIAAPVERDDAEKLRAGAQVRGAALCRAAGLGLPLAGTFAPHCSPRDQTLHLHCMQRVRRWRHCRMI